MSWIMDSVNKVHGLEGRIKVLEEQLSDFTYNTLQTVQSHLKRTWGTHVQSETLYGLRFGLCVDTKDPHAQGRIRVFIGSLDKRSTPIKGLYWAYPISPLGGFDDSGALWVPPAGSTVALLFESGDRESPYYLGSVWTRDRGAPPHNWDYGVPEYECIHQGHRDGYFTGKNDESQNLPPSNTECYNIKDFDDSNAFSSDTEALQNVTPAHTYVVKTPNKHRLKFDDGNYACNHRWKRIELGSSCGHTFLMWDDHMNAAGQQLHPKAASSGPSATGGGGQGIACGDVSCGPSPDDRRAESDPDCGDHNSTQFINQLFKHESEVRAFRGPQTPQNNKCELQQTGVFLSSISGHIFVQDDEVEDPRGVPNWERSTSGFDFGCTDKYLGKMFLKSTTGHMIKLGDAESSTGVRSGDFRHPVTNELEPNGITLLTASGNKIEMNDHTLNSGIAGQNRGIRIESTSRHLLELNDYTNEQKSPERTAGGVPTSKATEAYVRLKSGYGLQLLMRDDNNQESTQQQFIELLAPHKDNCHGPHILRMQEAADGPGLVFLRAGGFFYGCSIKEWIEVVGSPQEGTEGGPKAECEVPASKLTKVTEHDIHDTEEAYIYLSDIEFHHAEQFIILAAGRDCPPPEGSEQQEDGPCIYPVIVGKKPWACPFTGFIHWGWESMSDRVFASASDD